jgi:hypothetical protein
LLYFLVEIYLLLFYQFTLSSITKFDIMAPPEGLPEMEYRFLGRSGLKVSAISLGGWLTYGGHVENGKGV